MADSVDGHTASEWWGLHVSVKEKLATIKAQPSAHSPPALVGRFQTKNHIYSTSLLTMPACWILLPESLRAYICSINANQPKFIPYVRVSPGYLEMIKVFLSCQCR